MARKTSLLLIVKMAFFSTTLAISGRIERIHKSDGNAVNLF